MTRRGTPLPQPSRPQISAPPQIDHNPYAGDPYELRHRVEGMPPEPRRQRPPRLSRPVRIGWTILFLIALSYTFYLLVTY